MKWWVRAAWMACAFVAGWLLREPVPPLPAQLPVEEDYSESYTLSAEAFLAIEQRVEQALYSEQVRLQQQLATLAAGTPGQTELYFLGIAGDGTQRVFGREIDFIHQQLQQRYDLRQRSVLLINDRERIGEAVMATRTSVEDALRALARQMNPDEDVLLLYLTSHGSEQHDIMLDQEGLLLPDLSAQALQLLLDEVGIRWQLVIVSACYSGGVVPLLQHPDRLVMTSAAADRASFGCTDDAELTYFGRALFAEAFPRFVQWPEMFAAAQRWIEQQEQAEDMLPSLPQLAVGERILPQLARVPLQGESP